MNQNNMSTAKLAKLAMMTAVSLVLLFLVRIPWPPAPFLVYDPADVPIYITAFAFGPVEGLLVTLVVCLLQAFGLGGDGFYGFIMHFVATGIVAVVIGMMYKKNKTKKNDLMCFALCEDRTSAVEAVVFPNLYAAVGAIVRDGAVIYVSGKLAVKEEEQPKLLADIIESGDMFVAAFMRKGICIRVSSSDKDKLERIKTLAEQHRSDGGVPLKIYFSDKKLMTALKTVRAVSLDEKLLKEFIEAAGHGNVRFLER